MPRRCGTDGHDTVRTFLTDELSTTGWSVAKQTFAVSSHLYRLSRRMLFAISVCLFLLIVSTLFAAWITPVFAIATAALSLTLRRWAREQLDWRTRKAEPEEATGTNIYVETGDDSTKPWLILSAHYDSKSQSLSMKGRIATTVTFTITTALLIAAGFLAPVLFQNGVPNGFKIAFVSIFLISNLAALLLSGLGVENDSPGAFDNGAAIALLLEQARRLSGSCPEHLGRITILLPDAEEWGLQGAAAWADQRLEEIDAWAGPVLCFNLDGVGGDNPGRLVGKAHRNSSALLDRLKKASERSEWKITLRTPLIGFLVDSVAFEIRGLDAVSLVTTGSQVSGIHTKNDAIEKLNAQGIESARNFLTAFIDQS